MGQRQCNAPRAHPEFENAAALGQFVHTSDRRSDVGNVAVPRVVDVRETASIAAQVVQRRSMRLTHGASLSRNATEWDALALGPFEEPYAT